MVFPGEQDRHDKGDIGQYLEPGAPIYDQPPLNWFMTFGLPAMEDLPALDFLFKENVDIPLARICLLRAVACGGFSYGKAHRSWKSVQTEPDGIAQSFIRDDALESEIFAQVERIRQFEREYPYLNQYLDRYWPKRSDRYDGQGKWRYDNPWIQNSGPTESYAAFAARRALEENQRALAGIEELNLGYASPWNRDALDALPPKAPANRRWRVKKSEMLE